MKFPITEEQAQRTFVDGVAYVTSPSGSQVIHVTQLALNGVLDLTHDWKGTCETPDGDYTPATTDNEGTYRSPMLTTASMVQHNPTRESLDIRFPNGLHIHLESKLHAPLRDTLFHSKS